METTLQEIKLFPCVNVSVKQAHKMWASPSGKSLVLQLSITAKQASDNQQINNSEKAVSYLDSLFF